MREIWTKEKVNKELTKYIQLQGTQIGVKKLEEIIRQIVEAAYSGSPGPTPALNKCLQVDHAQSFTEAEKEMGRINLGVYVSDFNP